MLQTPPAPLRFPFGSRPGYTESEELRYNALWRPHSVLPGVALRNHGLVSGTSIHPLAPVATPLLLCVRASRAWPPPADTMVMCARTWRQRLRCKHGRSLENAKKRLRKHAPMGTSSSAPPSPPPGEVVVLVSGNLLSNLDIRVSNHTTYRTLGHTYQRASRHQILHPIVPATPPLECN